MVTVAEELPFVAVVDDEKLSVTCSNCFASNLGGNLEKVTTSDSTYVFVQHVDLKKCARCHTIYYCCRECQREDWKHHKDECTFLINSKYCPEKYVRFISRTVIRVKKGDLPVAFNGRTFDDLMDHYIGGIAFYVKLKRFMGVENVPSCENFFSIYGKLRMNSYGIHSHDAVFEVGTGLYLGLSAHDHSCRPDCVYTFIGQKAALRAKDPNAKYNTSLTCAYLDVTLSRKIRQERLQNTHYFYCECDRCLDEEEDLWERSGKSPCCPDGVVLPRNNGEPLVCSKCGKKSSLTLKQINYANEELEIFCDEVKKDQLKQSITSLNEVKAYKKLFHKMENILSPFNLYLSKISEVMGDILARFNLIDEMERMRFVRAEEKVMDRYSPFNGKTILAKNVVYIMEKQLLLVRCANKRQLEKVTVAGRKLCTALKEIFGPEHPLTKEYQKSKMVTIAEELPYVYIVDDKYVKTTCSYCFAANIIEEGLDKLVDLKKCGRCQNIYYCSVKCQREDWEHHKSECTFLVNAKSCPDLYVRFVSRAIMRVKSGTFALSFNGRYFNDLVDHADDIIASPPVYHYIKTLYNELVKYMGAENVPPEKDVISIYGKLRTNSMAITSSDGLEAVGHGLYLGLSAHDHSCRPDCAYTFVGPMAILRAKDRNTKYNTDLTLSYVPLTLPRKIRQERLQEGYFFFCQCERCMDEEEDLLERSGKSTCCSDGVVLPRDNGRPLVCSKCGKTTSLTLQKIINANKELLRYSREPNKMISHREAEEYKKLFYKMERILSPYNLYLLRIVEVMSDIYFDFIDERIYFFRAEKKVLKRYAPFSGQMIMILRCIFNSERELVIDCMTQRQYDRVIDAGKKLYAALREFCDPEYYLTKEVKEEVNEFIKEKALI